MIGFNGTSYSDPSDRAANPLLQGLWHRLAAKIRTEAPHRVSPASPSPRVMRENKIIAKGTYGT